VSFVGGYHPDADRHDSDDERQPLLTQDGQRRTKRKLSALFNSRRQEGLELPGPFHRRYGEEEERSWRSVVGIAICIIAVLSVIVAAAVVVADNPMSGGAPHHSPSGRHPSYLIHAAHGAVASEASTCSNVGVKILKDGGNAVDAAIAANLCVGVVNMFSTGIGGGGFMTIMIPHERHVWTVDFRETAPAASNSTMFLKDPLSSIWGGLSVGVPGELRGMAEAHSRWGKLPWRRLFQESIKLAEGFAATRVLEDRLRACSFSLRFTFNSSFDSGCRGFHDQ
jgi:gamma-glutamyltranspeptidase/glutathione hydrolase/leukotriene-C4 hydrolase